MTTNLLAAALLLAACGEDAPATPIDAGPDTDIDAGVPGTYVQIEHLARPGIAEALLINNAFLAGYNATAPTFAGGATATLDWSSRRRDGAEGDLPRGVLHQRLDSAAVHPRRGVQPAARRVNAVGGRAPRWQRQLTAASMTRRRRYADRIFGQFIRRDAHRSRGREHVSNLCAGAAANIPLLCGGRLLNDTDRPSRTTTSSTVPARPRTRRSSAASSATA